MHHETFMYEALRLAALGKSAVAPNPLVGAVVVKNGAIIGKGYHTEFGEEHAEIVAIRNAGQQTKGACLYVNLEPCSSQWEGKQHPPCVDAIVAAGIKTLVIAHSDPNKHVSGKGIQKLRSSGITVRTGVCKDDALRLNQAYLTNVCRGESFLHLKFAMSLDGKIALSNGVSKWISGTAARHEVHQMRSMHTGVMVGCKTVIQDNPQLTVRHVKGPDPLRIVLDRHFSVPITAHIVEHAQDGKTLLCISEAAISKNAEKMKACGSRGVRFLIVPQKHDASLLQFFVYVQKTLFSRGVSSILLEGGARTLATCLSEGLWHRMSIFIAPMIIGEGISPFQDMGHQHSSMEQIFRYPTQWVEYDDGIKAECYNPACTVDL